jgi:hypothetical protein
MLQLRASVPPREAICGTVKGRHIMTMIRTLLSAATVAAATLMACGGANAQSALGDPLFAVLNGGNECTNPGPVCRKGDLDGMGSATIFFGAPLGPNVGLVCWGITADNLAGSTVAHIHRGPAGVNGGIVVTLSAPGGANPGAASGCRAVATNIINLIRADPTSFYVNVHNGAFPDGAIRGQLH